MIFRKKYSYVFENENASAYSWIGEQWGRRCKFYSMRDHDAENAVIVILTPKDRPDELHFHFSVKPSEADMNSILERVAQDYKRGELLSTSGNGSPGGIHGLLRLCDHGFEVSGYADNPKSNHWGDTYTTGKNQERFDRWIKKHIGDPYVGVNDEGTYPKYPRLRKR